MTTLLPLQHGVKVKLPQSGHMQFGILCIQHTWSFTCNGDKEYVARMTCLYKNNGAVSCVVGKCLIHLFTLPAHRFASTLIPNCMGSCHGQILIETATHSFGECGVFLLSQSVHTSPVAHLKLLNCFSHLTICWNPIHLFLIGFSSQKLFLQ